jgi:hypothetical protein
VFGGDESGGLLDWLIDECDARHQPGVGQLAAEFERRYLGRPVPQGSLLDRMKTLWGTVASKVAEYLSDPVASAVLQAARKRPRERSPYEKELMTELVRVLHEMKRRQRLLPQEVRGRAVHAIVHVVHAIPPSLPPSLPPSCTRVDAVFAVQAEQALEDERARARAQAEADVLPEQQVPTSH